MVSFTLKLLAGLTLLVGVAIPFVPEYLYEENYQQKANAILDSSSLSDRSTTVFVTGANSGLGLATIQHLAQRATATASSTGTMSIVMGCRNRDKCTKARDLVLKEIQGAPNPQGLQLLPVTMDLSDFESLSTLASHLKDKLPTTEGSALPEIHFLLLNEGVAAPTPQTGFHPATGVENHYHTNHLGHALLVHHLWPYLKASVDNSHGARKARIVTVSEGGALFPVDPLKGWYKEEDTANVPILSSNMYSMARNIQQYARSKQAQLYFASELQARYDDVITASAAQPGYTRTPIYVTNFEGFPNWLKYLFRINPVGSMSPAQGSLTLLLAMLDETAMYVGPKWFFFGPPVVVGRASNLDEGSIHHRPFTATQTHALWDQTLKLLRIARFGEATYVSM